MTWPAESVPSCPLTSTTRVDATLSANRSSVANSSTVGKLEKSSGFAAFSATISTASEIMMLVMNPMSSMIAGTGTIMNSTTISVAMGSTAPLAALIQIFALTWAGVIRGRYLPRVASMR